MEIIMEDSECAPWSPNMQDKAVFEILIEPQVAKSTSSVTGPCNKRTSSCFSVI